MENTITTSAMSASLLARNVYGVCFPLRDSLDALHSEFAAAREKFFTGGKKPVRVGRSEVVRGFDGRLRGKLSRRSLYWKKTATGMAGQRAIALEEAFDQRGGYVLVTRDFRNLIVSRTFFDKGQIWLKSEYYEPWDAGSARVIFKPNGADDTVERFDWDSANNRYRSTLLYPVPYLPGTPEQSIVNSRFGQAQFLVSTGEGQFCYCPQQEAQARRKALEEIQGGTIVLMPAWEVKEGALAGEEGEEDTRITFTSLEEYARIQPAPGQEEPPVPSPAPEAAAPAQPEAPEGEEFTHPADQEEPPHATAAEGPAPGEQDKPAGEPAREMSEDQEILEAARKAALQEEKPSAGETASPLAAGSYRGSVREGKITGRGRTQRAGGLTAYDGEYQDGKRHGFGSYYYKDGDLCYAGFWKEDKKDGLGVSFRDGDHALHIARWSQGKPGEMVSLFDSQGNLRYGGRMVDGKKQGAGVTVNPKDGTVFVAKWEDGKNTGVGSAFDPEGNLLYYGAWKDGKRHGQGTEFDKNGAIVFDGEWRDGKYYNGILYQKLGGDVPSDADDAGPTWDL